MYPDRPMTTIHRPQDGLARERAHELIRAFDGRAGSLGSLLGRVTPVDRVGAWFQFHLVDGKRGLPALPKVRAGR